MIRDVIFGHLELFFILSLQGNHLLKEKLCSKQWIIFYSMISQIMKNF